MLDGDLISKEGVGFKIKMSACLCTEGQLRRGMEETDAPKRGKKQQWRWVDTQNRREGTVSGSLAGRGRLPLRLVQMLGEQTWGWEGESFHLKPFFFQ